jgi:hypothetical protein
VNDVEVFQHDTCRIRYQVDLFWVSESIGIAQIEKLLEVFSRDRNGREQPIFEVRL